MLEWRSPARTWVNVLRDSVASRYRDRIFLVVRRHAGSGCLRPISRRKRSAARPLHSPEILFEWSVSWNPANPSVPLSTYGSLRAKISASASAPARTPLGGRRPA